VSDFQKIADATDGSSGFPVCQECLVEWDPMQQMEIVPSNPVGGYSSS